MVPDRPASPEQMTNALILVAAGEMPLASAAALSPPTESTWLPNRVLNSTNENAAAISRSAKNGLLIPKILYFRSPMIGSLRNSLGTVRLNPFVAM